jgi:glycosyl hydrolase family 42 (putative beta-galactosidase)
MLSGMPGQHLSRYGARVRKLLRRHMPPVGLVAAGVTGVLVLVGFGIVVGRQSRSAGIPDARPPASAPGSPSVAPAPSTAGSQSAKAPVDKPAPRPGVPIAGTGVAPFVFGTLETQPEHAAAEAARGVKVAMMELNWAAYEPAEGRFDEAYARQARDRLAALRGAGMRVTLGLGLHYTPEWLFQYPDSRLIDQHGARSGGANLVFNQRLREKAERYLARIDRDLGMHKFWAIRLNSGAEAEVLYPPGGSYWAFDRNAQNGPDLPPTMAANPRPGWRPGDRSVSRQEVQRWADWYVGGLDDVVAWQMRFITALGFTGYYQVLTPGSGTKPQAYARDVRNYLPDGITGVGAVWHRFYANLPDKRHVVVYVSSMADEPGRPHSCARQDRAVPLTDPRVNAWPATRWLARVAREYGLALNGENPGWNMPARLNGHYTDNSGSGMMAASVREMVSCGFQGMYWAHDEQLWDGTASFDRYASWIATTNGGDNPVPGLP